MQNVTSEQRRQVMEIQDAFAELDAYLESIGAITQRV